MKVKKWKTILREQKNNYNNWKQKYKIKIIVVFAKSNLELANYNKRYSFIGKE